MKRTNQHCVTRWILFFSFLFGFQLLEAQDGLTINVPDDTAKFNISDTELNGLIQKSDIIFVGKVTKIGLPALKASGRLTYHGVQITVSSVLKGAVDTKISVTLYSRNLVEDPPPTGGNSYIFFAQAEKGLITVLKHLNANDDALGNVRRLMDKNKNAN